MAASSIAALFFAAMALPAGVGACQQQRQPRRLVVVAAAKRRYKGTARREAALAGRLVVAAAAKRRYKGTPRREAALVELVEWTVAEAMEACTGHEAEAGCRVAWDEVEEVSQARTDLRRCIAEAPGDPLEPFCVHNPDADDCAVVYVDD